MDSDTECEARLLSCELINLSIQHKTHQNKSFTLNAINSALSEQTGCKTIHKASTRRWSIINTSLFILGVALWFHLYLNSEFEFVDSMMEMLKNSSSSACLYDDGLLTLVTQELTRPEFNCSLCENKTEPIVLQAVDPISFARNYAYLAIPILVKNAFKNCSATEVFSYEYFRNTYDSVSGSYDTQEKGAQFFGYKTEFETLEEALHMNQSRRNKSWYFGWNNAVPEVEEEFRKHFIRPSIIPFGDGIKKIDWIFMGTAGKGAPIHLDNVQFPSWQAQLRGVKTWTLQPSAECMSICPIMHATVHPGDMIFVDTNQWYHSTEIHEGDISITIGSEYD